MWSQSQCAFLFLFPSGGDGGSGGIMEWVFAPFQQSLHMASCLLCLFIASFWETLHSPRMQHKPKHLSVPSPEPVTQGILLFLPYFSTHTFSHLTSPPPPPPPIPLSSAGHRFLFFEHEHEGDTWVIALPERRVSSMTSSTLRVSELL